MRRARAIARKQSKPWACALAVVSAMLDAARLRLADKNRAARASGPGLSGRTTAAAATATAGLAGRGSRAARHFLDFLRSLLGTDAVADIYNADPADLLRKAGVRGIGGRAEVCERTASAAFHKLAVALPEIFTVTARGVSIRLRRVLRFAAGLGEVASITPAVVRAAWKTSMERALSGASAGVTLSGGGLRGTHARKLGLKGSAAQQPSSRPASVAGLGGAPAAPAEAAAASPAVSPASAGGARGRFPHLPSGSRWRWEAPIAGALIQEQHGLDAARRDIGPVGGRHPFVELAQTLLETAAQGPDGVPAGLSVDDVAVELRRAGRLGRLVREGGRWIVCTAANPVLALQGVAMEVSPRPASARMRRHLVRAGVPADWARELGHEEARRLQFALDMEIHEHRCPRLEVAGRGRYEWRRVAVRRRSWGAGHSLRAKIEALGERWQAFEQASRGGVEASPAVQAAVAMTSYTGRPA